MKGEDKLEIILIKINIKIGIDLTVEIGECHIKVMLSMDKTIEEGHTIIQIKEVTLGEGNFRGTQNDRGQNFRGGYRGNFKMTNLVEVEVDLEENSNHVTLEEMREAVVDQDQVQEQVLIEIESDVLYHFAKDCPNISDTEKEESE